MPMEETTANSATKRYAVVTGANKGIGLEICRQLASEGIKVVLTARNEKRGLEAVEELNKSGFSESVVFHQLNVVDPLSIASLAEFLESQFGKLDILVNNAGIAGSAVNGDAFRAAEVAGGGSIGADVNWNDILLQTYEMAKECLETNYHGVIGMTNALIPLLLLSESPRIVNVSSGLGKLKNIPGEWAKEALRDVENLTEERLDELLKEFLEDFKQGKLESKGWPVSSSAYTVSKAALNAYTKLAAKKHPNLYINCVCPGYVKTDLNFNTGTASTEQGAACVVKVVLIPDGGASGCFFHRNQLSSFD